MLSRLHNYYLGSVLLLFSEGLYDFAIAIYAFQISGKASVGAITYGIGYFAEIAVSLIGGGYLDRFSKLKIFTVTILFKVAAFSILIFYGHNMGLTEVALWGFALVIDAVHHFSKLNNTTAVADIFEGSDLIKAHGGIAAVQGSARVIGPLLGGVLVSWFGAIDSLIFCAGFQLTALFYFFRAFRGFKHKPQAVTDVHTALGTLQALRNVWCNSFWRRYFALDSLTTLLSGTSVLLMVPLMKTLLNVEDEMLGSFFALGALGSIAGGFLITRMLKLFRLGHWMAAMLTIEAASLFLLLFSGHLYIAAVLKFVLDFAVTSYFRTSAIYFQSHAPENQRSAYYCGADAVSRSLGLVGVVSAGFIFDYAGAIPVYLGLASGMLILGMAWWASFSDTTIS